MESSEDKQWATKYLLDPLNAPEPSEETGPGSHFVRPVETPLPTPTMKGPTATTSKVPSVSVYPSPPTSASPTQSSFHHSNPYSPNHRQAAFADYQKPASNQSSLDESADKGKGHRRRGSSLTERFPGDMSHRPLDQLRKEAKAAKRAPHLKKKHLPGADTIDSLDMTIGGPYHHEGPYDATLLARNTNYKSSPVEAVRGTNNEALRATPREYIQDSLTKKVPLQGTSIIPPGMEGIDGRKMQYREGADLMREADAPGGAYKRWADVDYLPEDLKGKGEPSFSIEKALKEHDRSGHNRSVSDNYNSYEMQPRRPVTSRQRSISNQNMGYGNSSSLQAMKYADFEGEMRRSNSTGGRFGEGLKKRFGSIRRSKKTAEA